MKNTFIQIHTLTSYSASLLNRDDQGFAKRVSFGGVSRTRISSQCLKRHWRVSDGEHSLRTVGGAKVEHSIRSRKTFEEYVLKPLLAAKVDEALARKSIERVMVEVLGESAKASRSRKEEEAAEVAQDKVAMANVETNQVTVLGEAEVRFFLQEAQEIAKTAGTLDKVEEVAKKRFTKEWQRNLAALKRAAGLEAALFGRMVTSDKLARADAAVHVAHALTVHAEEAETDYFAAIDDLVRDSGELGSGHIGNTELTSGLFYGYVVVDTALLVANLEGCPQDKWISADRTLAADVVHSLVQTIARVSPGAKLGSTAPYAAASLVLVESGLSQPRSLSNAFLKPVRAKEDLLRQTYAALGNYVEEADKMYGNNLTRKFAALAATEDLKKLSASQVSSVDEVAKFAAASILEAG